MRTPQCRVRSRITCRFVGAAPALTIWEKIKARAAAPPAPTRFTEKASAKIFPGPCPRSFATHGPRYAALRGRVLLCDPAETCISL